MAVTKLHDEFHSLDMNSGWQHIPGYPDGIMEKILAGELDEKGQRGSRTRLLRFAPAAYTTKPFVHDYWEEVFMLSGDLIVGNDDKGHGGTSFQPFTYACRPPGATHGPFASKGGCVLLEIHYFDPV
jgi:ChrR Cupin-like domain